MRKLLLVAVAGGLLALPRPGTAQRASGAADSPPRPNIVLVLTDDQRFDELSRMPILRSELAAKGTSFSRFYAVNPLCCPSRTTILTGQYSHTTGVYFNEGDQGGWKAFRYHEPFTIATSLRSAGYRTALVGKYLNEYRQASHVPPGWDRWVAMTHVGYFGIPLSVDGVPIRTGRDEYSTDVITDYAVDFIDGVPASQPLFLMFTPYAPHTPSEPAPRDREALHDVRAYRPPSYDEPDRSDKPTYVRQRGRLSASERRGIDRVRVDMMRSLLAVDRSIGRLLDALDRTGRLDNTLVMFASDNGYLWGEHGFVGKNLPYEESVRLPLIVRWDGHVRAGATDDHLVGNIDLAPTWADLGGALLLGAEGRSLVPLFTGDAGPWRQDLLIEHGKIRGDHIPAFCQIHGTRYSYVLYATGEEELYDLDRDPYQLSNLAGQPAYASVLNQYRTRDRLWCLPQPPGWSLEGDLAGVSAVGR